MRYMCRVANIVFQKSLNSQSFFCKVKLKFLNFRVLAGGFVMECAKKVVEKSAA